MTDFSLPSPLLQPQTWMTQLDRFDEVVLSLNFAVQIGGCGAASFEEMLHLKKVFWRVDSKAFGRNAVEANEWLKLGGQPLWEGSSTKLSQAPRVDEWAREVGVKFWETAGEEKAGWLIKNYLASWPEASSVPFEGLRFFAGYLRQVNEKELAVAFARDWAYAQALFSPHDEVKEAASLEEAQVMVNPTLQIVRDFQSYEMHADWRLRDRVQSRKLQWAEAALIDEVSENFRLSQNELLARVTAELANSPLNLNEPVDFKLVFNSLVRDGVLLAPIAPARLTSDGQSGL